jgi:hypothetical protein
MTSRISDCCGLNTDAVELVCAAKFVADVFDDPGRDLDALRKTFIKFVLPSHNEQMSTYASQRRHVSC